MPLNHLELQPQIKEFAANASQAQLQAQEKLRIALEWLHECALTPLDGWQGHLNASSQRCAVPGDEKMDAGFACGQKTFDGMILSADGSQIIPSAHDSVPLSLINTSLICLDAGASSAPQISLRTEILKEEHEGVELPLLSEDLINLKRDVSELRVLADWQAPEETPVVALRDGPLELYHEPRQGAEFAQAFQVYQTLLKELAKRKFILAGYIDRSRAALLANMLEIFADKNLEKQPGVSLEGLSDVVLMGALLPAGQRSAIYKLHSSSSEYYKGDLAVYFFYLNVSRNREPYIVRVEVPAWVARSAGEVNKLHCALLEQCRLMGSRPYPYLLHRAHEEAVVHQDEKESLQNALAVEMQRQGLDCPLPSNKLSAKELQSRTRI
jgi:hypothetical protein